MHHDVRALPQTAASAEALRAYDATVEAYLGFELATGDRLKETFALDPAMPMAHCLKGCFLLLFAKRDLTHRAAGRSEEHTSELQSLMRTSYAVFCLKKKK